MGEGETRGVPFQATPEQWAGILEEYRQPPKTPNSALRSLDKMLIYLV